ncbi:hypothetical protein D9M68_430780 [compost metagenome]
MKIVAVFMAVLASISTTGCAENIFQPPPPAFDEWSISGVDRVEVKKKLLECGMPEPTGKSSGYQSLDRNAQASIDFCMEHAGFKLREGSPRWCKNYREMNLAICAPGAKIPRPSVSKRLNGSYCKINTDYDFCKRNARHPNLCDLTDYSNPPLECRP